MLQTSTQQLKNEHRTIIMKQVGLAKLQSNRSSGRIQQL